MPVDLSNIGTLNTFRAALNAASDDDIFTVEAKPGTESSKARMTWDAVSAKDRLDACDKIVCFLKEAVREEGGISTDAGEYLPAKVVQQLRFNHGARLDSSLLKVGVVRRLLSEIPKDLQASGCCRRVYEQMEFQEDEETRNVIRWLFGDPKIIGHNFSVFTPKLLKAAALRKNDELLGQAKGELQSIGVRLFEEIQSGALTPSGLRLTEILIGQILALYPFFEPETGTELTVPQKIDGQWQLVTFTVEQIPLTPEWLGPPILAFGLLPKEGASAGAYARILLPGTSQPTASWSPLDTWSDFIPGYSVGEFVFTRWGKQRLKTWIEERAKERVDVTGISLGGSLTLQFVSHFPDLVRTARAFVPPAVRAPIVAAYEKRLTEIDPALWPDVSLYWQDGDIVSLIGAAWSKQWKAYRLIPGKRLDFISAHNKQFSAQPLTALMRIDVVKDSKRLLRQVLNLAYEIIKIPIFVLLTMTVAIRALIYRFKS